MNTYLEYQDEKSDKFWQIETRGKSFTVNYGKRDTKGQTQTKEFETAEECLKEAGKAVAEKLKKGYAEVQRTARNDKVLAGPGDADDQSGPGDPGLERYLLSEKELEASFSDFDHEYERHVDTLIDLSRHEIILDYVLDINKDYLDTDDEDDAESDQDERYASRNSQKKLLFASAPAMRKFVNLLVEELSKHCFEIYYDYNGSKQVMENDVFLKLIDLFFKGADPYSPKKGGGRALEENQFADFIKGIREWFDVQEDQLAHAPARNPKEKLKEITEKANQYFYKADYRKALDILREADPLLFIPKNTSQKYALNAFFNLRAACHKKTNDWENALADYTQAFSYGNSRAGNHLISIYLDVLPDLDKALAIAMQLGDFSDYQYNKYGEENYALRNKKGYIQVLRGDKKSAEEIYRMILKDFAVQYPERIVSSIKDLRKIIDGKHPNAGIAEEILTWFTRQT